MFVFAISFTVQLNARITNVDCFGRAIEHLEEAEENYGPLSDQAATSIINTAYANCEMNENGNTY